MKIEAKNLYKAFADDRGSKVIAAGFTYSFPESGLVCLLGESGSGKTTLLNMLSSLLRPDSGSICYDGEDIYSLSGQRRAEFRAAHIGYVFQEGNLLEDLTVLDNLRLAEQDEEAIDHWLDAFGVLPLKNVLASKLSGGEKQRVAIARCLLKRCDVIFFDEPTASLDGKNAEEVLAAIGEAAKASLCVVSTHDRAAAEARAGAIIEFLGEGRIEVRPSAKAEIKPSAHALPAQDSKRRGGKLGWLFGWKSIWRRKSKAIALMTTSIIAMMLAIGQGSVSSFDPSRAIAAALRREQAWIVPLERTQTNPDTGYPVTTQNGPAMKSYCEQLFSTVVPMIPGNLTAIKNAYYTNVYLLPYVQGMEVGGKVIPEPKQGQAVASSFLKALSPDKLSLMMGHNGGGTVEFDYGSFVDVEYSQSFLQSYRSNPISQPELADQLMKRYGFAVLSQQDFYHLFDVSKVIYINGGNFLQHTASTMSQYAHSRPTYGTYSDENLIYGRAPSARDEVVVSTDFLQRNGILEEKFAATIGRRCAYRDLASSPDHVAYEGFLNLYALQKEVTIVGITDAPTYFLEVLTHADFFSDITAMLLYYEGQLVTIDKDVGKVARQLIGGQITSTYRFLRPIYYLNSLSTGFVRPYLLTLAGIMFALIAIIGFSLGFEGVVGKERRIALLMSLGHSPRELSLRYAAGGALFQAICFAVATLLSFVAIASIDAMLSGERVLNISYPLVRLEFLPLLVCFGVALFSAALASLRSIIRLGRIDIAKTFRNKA